MDVPGKNIVSAADAHIQRVRIQAPAVAHKDLWRGDPIATVTIFAPLSRMRSNNAALLRVK